MATDIRLSAEEYARLIEAERALLDAVNDFNKAEDCGIDCSIFRQLNFDAVNRIQKIKQHYAPRE